MPTQTYFLLNDRQVGTAAAPGMLVLDFLRQRCRRMGTKEGCREGDCGACTVLVGELDGSRVAYRPVTSCLLPVGELQGKHLVTVEGLNTERLTPVQQAIVDEGASQCGFCTPGIVVSLTGLLMQDGVELDGDRVKQALSGHLCRCTGYRSLKAAGEIVRREIGDGVGIEALVERGALPAWFRDVPARLRDLPRPEAEAGGDGDGAGVLIAGGTDLYVQRGDELPEAPALVLGLETRLRGVRRQNGHLRVGALTSFEDFAADPAVLEIVPDLPEFMFLVASWQIRNRATLGGNVVNASPIGDMTILLLALDAVLVLERGERRREVPMRSFFQGYKKLDKRPGEVLTEILVPVPPPGTRVRFEKVSKRKCLDIATVNLALSVRVEDGTLLAARAAAGGVAPVPFDLCRTAEALTGAPLSAATVEAAARAAQREISPISDVRGSADYKRLLVRQLLIAAFVELFPEAIRAEDFYAAP
jgi:xanthine dehydrogenase small subunit